MSFTDVAQSLVSPQRRKTYEGAELALTWLPVFVSVKPVQTRIHRAGDVLLEIHREQARIPVSV